MVFSLLFCKYSLWCACIPRAWQRRWFRLEVWSVPWWGYRLWVLSRLSQCERSEYYMRSFNSPILKLMLVSLPIGLPWLHLLQTRINFDQNTSSIEVVFTPTKPVVLIDDVKFKFYTTNVSSYWSILKEIVIIMFLHAAFHSHWQW